MEPSYAVKRRNGYQAEGRRTALRAGLRPQLELWFGLAWEHMHKSCKELSMNKVIVQKRIFTYMLNFHVITDLLRTEASEGEDTQLHALTGTTQFVSS